MFQRRRRPSINTKGGVAVSVQELGKKLADLKSALREVFCADLVPPQFRHEYAGSHDISFGQCVPTALLVNDLFGGEILFGYVDLAGKRREWHCWNRIDGQEVDLTVEQFPKDNRQKQGARIITRDELFETPHVVQRYNLLKQLLEKRRNGIKIA